ncbi:MAG: histidine kinase [Actinobacteria bacterium]|nr:MAG: histidine kinase [Actinomycetota bacterium]
MCRTVPLLWRWRCAADCSSSVARVDTTLAREAATETERLVAWLRLPAIGLLILARELPHPNPEKNGFYVALALFSVWSIGALVWVTLRPASGRFALSATALDVTFFTALAVLSGGAFSNARDAYFLVPVAVAFRFRPAVTAIAAAATVVAYVIQAVVHPASRAADADRLIATFAGYLIWVGAACVALSALLARRTEAAAQLADARSRLLADALSAEQRERKSLAEGLHDHAVQNLLSALHELEEATEEQAHPALGRAEHALVETVQQLRDAIFELHPYVLDEAGLDAAVRSVATRAAERAGVELRLDVEPGAAGRNDQLLFSAVRELLTNVVRHARAKMVSVTLRPVGDDVLLVVEDDGSGLDPKRLGERLADGHIGLASQRVRIESAGGRMSVVSRPGLGTRAEVRLPRV